MSNWILSNLDAGKIDHGQATRANIPAPEKLEWSVSASTASALTKAETTFKELIEGQDLEVNVHRFGANMAKSLAVSPDAVNEISLTL
jgi:hypothetical protein